MRRKLLTGLFALALQASAPLFVADTATAQSPSTWIVDVGGTGHFTSLEDAYRAAAPGDTLKVMPGEYDGFGNAEIGVSILGAGRDLVTIRGGMVFDRPLNATTASARLLLSGLTVDTGTGVPPVLGYGISIQGFADTVIHDLRLVGADHVTMALHLLASNAVINGVRIEGISPRTHAIFGGGSKSSITSSSLSLLRRSSVRGGGRVGLSAVELWFFSELVVDATKFEIQDQGGTPYAIASILGSSLWITNHTGLKFDGPVRLGTGSFADVDPSIPLVQDPMSYLEHDSRPSLTADTSTVLGGQATWNVRGESGRCAGLVLNDQPSLQSFEGILDNNAYTLGTPPLSVVLVTTDAAGFASVTVPVPNDPMLRDMFVYGQAFGWIGGGATLPVHASAVSVTRIH